MYFSIFFLGKLYQNFCIFSYSYSRDLLFWLFKARPISLQTFSNGFKSGNWCGHVNKFTLSSSKNFIKDFALCFGSLTCMKIQFRVVQLLHSCGPLFKIIRVCGPQSAKNSYFRSKIRVFSKKKKRSSLGIGLQNSYFRSKIRCSLKKKKKGLHLESVSKIPILAQNHSVLQKKITAAASDRQDLCKIDMRHAAREPVVGPRCYRRLPLLMIDKT